MVTREPVTLLRFPWGGDELFYVKVFADNHARLVDINDYDAPGVTQWYGQLAGNFATQEDFEAKRTEVIAKAFKKSREDDLKRFDAMLMLSRPR